MRQDSCLELLGTHSMAEVQANHSAIEQLMEALSFTVDIPLERIINAVKLEISDLISRARADILNSASSQWSVDALQILASQPYRFPRKELITFAESLRPHPDAVGLLNILSTYIDKHCALETRLTWLMKPLTAEEVQLLDPKENCEQIYHFLSYEFRAEMKIFAILYEVRAIVAASTNFFFLNTREFSERSVKRIVDTVLLFANALEWGLDSYRGRICIEKINEIHSRYYIPNESFKFILSGIMFIPEDWNNRFGWRPFTEIEKLGWFYAVAKMGKAMNIQDITDSYEEMKAWYNEYCNRFAQPSELKRKLFDQIIGQVLAIYPDQTRPIILSAILAGMDDVYRIATGYPQPPKEVCDAVKSAFFTIGHVGASLPRIPWIRTLQSNSVYPYGYQIEELGVNQRSKNLPQIHRFNRDGNNNSPVELPIFTMEEVKKHNIEGDLWVIIDNEVFDLTRFAQDHPGGKRVLLQHAGKDASVAFHKIGHTPAAKVFMMNYRIGKLDSGNERSSGCPFSALVSQSPTYGNSNG